MMLYKTFLADPPWPFNNKNTGGSMTSGSANQYQTMRIDEICNLKIPRNGDYHTIHDLADKNSLLFLWVPSSLKESAFTVMNAWGFKYKLTIYWYKPYNKESKKGKLGMGFYFRNQVEECLMGIRGKIKPFKTNKQNIIIEYPRKHSRKPEGLFNLIEPEIEKFDLNPKIELFAREYRTGWDGWGLEYPSKYK